VKILFAFERQHLSPAVVTARRAGDVRGNGTSALGAFVQMRSMPAVRRFAGAQSHLGCFAFWDSHISRADTKAEENKKATGFRFYVAPSVFLNPAPESLFELQFI
jgi:hypothetical protein